MSEKSNLDPDSWPEFRQSAHDLLDQCLTQLENAGGHPWQAVPSSIQESYKLSGEPTSLENLTTTLTENVLPYHTGNSHPSFFGWVHGTGLASGLLSEMISATMNSNCGGRDHGAIYMEREVINWSKETLGFPQSTSGLLVAGTSQATVIALQCARIKAFGADVRRTGQVEKHAKIYIANTVHNATIKAAELLGLGRDALVHINTNEHGMDIEDLKAKIHEDIAAGFKPMAIVATAGTVDLGRFDDLGSIAKIAKDENIWLHVDGAFGAWIGLAGDPWSALIDGMNEADSLACDFHKWMYVQYDCGLILIKDGDIHRQAFAARPNYLAPQSEGIGGGDPWYCDYGIDLSRGNRALKVWTAISHYGKNAFGESIRRNCELAQYMSELVDATKPMKSVRKVISNLCVFTADANQSPETQSELNTKLAQRLQLDGVAVFSTTKIDDIIVLRAAITNHRTQKKDIERAINAIHDLT